MGLSLVGIIAWLGWAADAGAVSPPVPMRMAVVINGPPALSEEVQEELTLPLSGVAQIVQTSAYRRAAAAIGIHRHPRSNRAAPFVGRALGVSYVLLVDVIKEVDGSGAHVVMGVRLVHAGSARVLMAQRYLLPGGRLTPSIAEAIRIHLLAMVAPPTAGHDPQAQDVHTQRVQPLAPPTPEPELRPEAVFAPRPGAGHGPLPPREPEPQAPVVAALPRPRASSVRHETPLAKPMAPASRPASGAMARRKSWIFVTPQLTWRRASLSPEGAPGVPIPYGAGHGLGRALMGGQVSFGYYGKWLGGELEGSAATGATSQTIDGSQDDGDVHHLSARAALALELVRGTDARVAPRVGVALDAWPLNLGPFVGLSYLAGTVGVRVATPVWHDVLQLEGTLDYLFLGKMGLEAARAGTPGFAQGVLIAVTPLLRLQRWRLGLNIRVDYRSSHFRGPTALYAPVHYQAMALGDTQLQLGLHIGICL